MMKKIRDHKNLLLAVATLWVIACVAGIGASNHMVSSTLMPRVHEYQRALRSHDAEILSDLERLSANSPFPPSQRSRNAHSLLANHVSWSGNGIPPLESSDHKLLKELFEKYSSWHKEPEQLKALLDDPRLGRIDAGWVAELRSFDYWKYLGDEKISKELARIPEVNGISRIGILASLPLPDFTEYRHWLAAYLLQKHRAGQTLEGLKAYRHAAGLAMTTHSLVGSMVSVAMLKAENQFAAWNKVTGWSAVDLERIEKLKAVSWTWAGLVRSTDFDHWNPAYDPYMKAELGFCGGVVESYGLAVLQDMLKPRWPFEPDFSGYLESSKRAQLKFLDACDLKELGVVQSDIPPDANPPSKAFTDTHLIDITPDNFVTKSQKVINPGYFPYVRRAFALMLYTIALPNFMRYYEKKDLASEPAEKAN